MQLNLNDWLGQTAWPWWLLVALLFLGAELVTRRRIAAVMSLGPLTAAGLAAASPRPFWPQLALAVLVGGLLALLVTRSNRPRRELEAADQDSEDQDSEDQDSEDQDSEDQDSEDQDTAAAEAATERADG